MQLVAVGKRIVFEHGTLAVRPRLLLLEVAANHDLCEVRCGDEKRRAVGAVQVVAAVLDEHVDTAKVGWKHDDTGLFVVGAGVEKTENAVL